MGKQLAFASAQTVKAILKSKSTIPASIAFGHPNTDLSGIFLKPIRDWDYPNKLPFVPKRRCLLVHNSANPDDDLVYSYVYDNLGNITAVSIYGILIESYEYDSLGQLIREDNVFEDYTKLYEYDKAGNIRYTSVMPYTSAPSANIAFAEGSILSYGYSSSSWGDLLTSYGGTSISYDAIGNPTNWRNTYSMSWDARRLTNQRMNNSDWLTYTYNADGIRTQKYFFNDIEMYGTTHDYVLDGTNIIRETVTGGGTTYTLHYLYDESGSVQGFIYNNNYYYYQKNLQGDVIRILDYSGNVVVEYTYDAWGKVLSVTGSLAGTIGQYNPFRYRGYYYDIETGFYYLQSRYYDPVVGRFLNADHPELIGVNGGVQGYNLFAYCNNNSVMGYDPTGHGWLSDIGDWFSDTWDEICDVAENVWDAVSSSFEMSVGHGTGLGVSVFDTGFGTYSDSTWILDDGEWKKATVASYGVEIFGFGVGDSYTHDDEICKKCDGNFSEVIDCKHSESTADVSFSYFSISEDGVKLGVSADLHILYGASFSVSFNFTKFVQRLYE